MPRNPQAAHSTTFVDFSKEQATTEIYIGAYNVVDNPSTLTQFGEYETALGNMTLCNKVADNTTWFRTKFSKVIPTDVNAQREDKWLVRYQGNTTFSPYHFEIPGADRSIGMLAGTDIADPTSAEYIAFKTKFEVVGRTPEGEGVTLLDITFVGRNT